MDYPKETCHRIDEPDLFTNSSDNVSDKSNYNHGQQCLEFRWTDRIGEETEPQMRVSLFKRKFLKRYVIAVMILISNMNLIFLQMNTVMVLAGITTSNVSSNVSTNSDTDLNWNSKQKGLILSTYSYGRLLCPIAGLLAARIGGSTTCSIANLVMALITFATPFIYENANFLIVVLCYAVLGVFEGFLFAGIPQLLSRWAPPDERSKFSAFSTMGLYSGAIASFMTSGWVLQTWGRNVLFYSGGFISFLWFWIWLLVVRNDPSEDTWISKSEQRYIRGQLFCIDVTHKLKYPWRRILTCVPFWCGCLSNFTMVFGNTFISLCLPQFMKDTYNIDIEGIGHLSTIPQISGLVSMSVCGVLCDYIRSKKILSAASVHKLYNGVSLFMGFFVFLLMALKSNFLSNLVAIVVYEFFSAFALIDVTVLLLDLSTKYAALLESTANMWANCAASIVPMVVGFIVTSRTVFQWGICFYGLSILHLFVGLIYLKLFPGGDGECSL